MTKRAKKIDRRLLGAWRSDKKLTLAEWVFPKTASPKGRQVMRSLFGKLTMRYTATHVFTELDGDRTSCRYKILAIDEESVAILRLIEDGRSEIQHVHFADRNVHWVSSGRNREFFRRVAA